MYDYRSRFTFRGYAWVLVGLALVLVITAAWALSESRVSAEPGHQTLSLGPTVHGADNWNAMGFDAQYSASDGGGRIKVGVIDGGFEGLRA